MGESGGCERQREDRYTHSLAELLDAFTCSGGHLHVVVWDIASQCRKKVRDITSLQKVTRDEMGYERSE